MAVIIYIAIIILFLVLIAFTWHNLSIVETKTKIVYIVVGLFILFICTLITFYISTNGVEYKNPAMMGNVRNLLMLVFVPINGLITMPYLANMLSKISLNEITKDQFKNKAIVLGAILIAALIIECFYFKNIQLGILSLLNNM